MRGRRWKLRRAGFTLIEVLVVMGVIGILIGLLLPAVQAAREAARRGQCLANLRQIGMALHNYESDHRTFPPAHLEMTRGPGFTTNETSAFVRLLPYLEERNLYASINLDLHGYDNPDAPIVENSTARRTTLGVLLCPSDGEPNHRTSYRFNSGRRRPGNRYLPLDGPFNVGFLPTPAAITDGLSQTAFLSERLGGSFRPGEPDPARDLKIPDDPSAIFTYRDDESYIAHCLASTPGAWIIHEGRYWYYFGTAYTAYNHNGAPNDPRPTCGEEVFGLLPPTSRHPGLVNVLFGDGHVEAVGNSVDQQVWRSRGSADSND